MGMQLHTEKCIMKHLNSDLAKLIGKMFRQYNQPL